jgi:hypothetical protein
MHAAHLLDPPARAPERTPPRAQSAGLRTALSNARRLQSAAITRYIARQTGFYPSDPWHVALADEAVAFTDDITNTLRPAFLTKARSKLPQLHWTWAEACATCLACGARTSLLVSSGSACLSVAFTG